MSREDRRTVYRARRLERFLSQPFFVTEPFTGHDGKIVDLADSLDGCERILNDEFSDLPERSLLYDRGHRRGRNPMKLTILLPGEVFMEAEVAKVVAEAATDRSACFPGMSTSFPRWFPGFSPLKPPTGGRCFWPSTKGSWSKCGPRCFCLHTKRRARPRPRRVEGDRGGAVQGHRQSGKKGPGGHGKDRGRFCPAVSGTERQGLTGPCRRKKR